MNTTLSPVILDRIRAEYSNLVRGADYPCLGARSAWQTSGTRVVVYGRMGDEETAAALARDLERFVHAPPSGAAFAALVAIFADRAPEDEATFERRLWMLLHRLSDRDSAVRADGASANPADAHYAFSFGGEAFFVIGLHPESSRIARRLAWPALVFNPHAQFRQLRASGRFESLRQAVRRRDIALQGDLNPNLADAGEVSEARQYSGRRAEPEWRCPFHLPDETE